MPTQYPIMTICGSMRFINRMLQAARYWTSEGWIVLMPFDTSYMNGVMTDDKKRMLDDMHKTKISMSEMVLVVNYDPAVQRDRYIGESTKSEIDYAEFMEIEIRYF